MITGAEPGGESISGADRFVEEEAGRIRSKMEKERSDLNTTPGGRPDGAPSKRKREIGVI